MTIPESIQKFITWIQGFDHRILQNEDDVKEKFILPMLHYLCYPERCRREYPLTSKSGNYHRNTEFVQVYYKTNDIQQQNTNNSLMAIKAIAPNETKLNEVVQQNKSYNDNFNALFFVITNGYDIKVFKRSHYYKEESVFDLNIYILKNNYIAS
ncbi:type I restriction enzyme HsdR N-terminal domain-containing protein, partial [Nostoc sp. UCD121]|uniref:type I restriction enzyme HsdR N-terminal domain-containing protein n=1 Tax=Nostoc sp. UCD121 TaxID=2681305 RepID=UPI001625A225